MNNHTFQQLEDVPKWSGMSVNQLELQHCRNEWMCPSGSSRLVQHRGQLPHPSHRLPVKWPDRCSKPYWSVMDLDKNEGNKFPSFLPMFCAQIIPKNPFAVFGETANGDLGLRLSEKKIQFPC